MEETNLVNEPRELRLNNDSMYYLMQTTKWAKFLAIVSFIGIAFILLMAFMGPESYMRSNPLQYQQYMANRGVFNAVFAVVMILASLIYFFPALYLYRFAVKTEKALLEGNQAGLTEGLKNMKHLFKFVGVLMIVYLVLMMLVAILGIAVM